MREVKFRAWDNSIKYFMPIMEWIEELKNAKYRSFGNVELLVKCASNIPNLTALLNCDEVEITQYTGLKDKNGTEIYEGDLVKCNGNKEDLHEVKFGKFALRDFDTYEIVDFVTGWYFIILEKDKLSKVVPFCYPTPLNGYWINKIDVKVVGNIFENKDLLEVE